jgi:hypothetical protein
MPNSIETFDRYKTYEAGDVFTFETGRDYSNGKTESKHLIKIHVKSTREFFNGRTIIDTFEFNDITRHVDGFITAKFPFTISSFLAKYDTGDYKLI